MTAKIIDGKAIADRLRADYRLRVDDLRSRHGVTPALAVILVGDNPASRSYVRGKIAGCKQVGIRSELIELPASVGEGELLARIQALNDDPSIHGILVQLPLPPQIRVASVVEQISVEKDVDGFHLYNMGGLVTGNTVFSPCTPYGVVKLLEHEHMKKMKNNAIVCNIGHFDNEIDVAALKQYRWENFKPQVDHVIFPDGKRIILLAEGRLVNLGCGTGHPSYVMSSSFANQTLAQIELHANNSKYPVGVYVLPKHLDEKVARLQLAKLGAKLTQLTAEQAKYIGVAQAGPYKTDQYRY